MKKIIPFLVMLLIFGIVVGETSAIIIKKGDVGGYYTFTENDYSSSLVTFTSSGTLTCYREFFNWTLKVMILHVSGAGSAFHNGAKSVIKAYQIKAIGDGSTGWADPDGLLQPRSLAEGEKKVGKKYTIQHGINPQEIDFEAIAAEGVSSKGPIKIYPVFFLTIDR